MNHDSGNALVLLASSLAISISANLDAEEIGILGSLFCAIGDNMAIIAAKRQNGVQENSRIPPSASAACAHKNTCG